MEVLVTRRNRTHSDFAIHAVIIHRFCHGNLLIFEECELKYPDIFPAGIELNLVFTEWQMLQKVLVVLAFPAD